MNKYQRKQSREYKRLLNELEKRGQNRINKLIHNKRKFIMFAKMYLNIQKNIRDMTTKFIGKPIGEVKKEFTSAIMELVVPKIPDDIISISFKVKDNKDIIK